MKTITHTQHMMEIRGLNTSSLIGEMKTRSVWKQDKTSVYTNNGTAMARKPVTSIAERRPNKERGWQSILVIYLRNRMTRYGISLRFNWVSAPTGYSAFYCDGECLYPLCSCMNTTTHTMIQLVVSMHYYTLSHMNVNVTGFSGKDGKWFRH